MTTALLRWLKPNPADLPLPVEPKPDYAANVAAFDAMGARGR